MVIGFTGTQTGMTLIQRKLVERLLGVATEAHHGDCIGADEQFHQLCQDHGHDIRIVVHPPTKADKRAYCEADEIKPVKPYLDRNRAIVAAADLMIATPQQATEPSPNHRRAGGTWWTIRHARSKDKALLIIWPDGRAEASGKVHH
jgi:hypothetical protein